MKTTALTIALLLGLVTGSAWAQSNGAKPKDKAGSVPEASRTTSAAGPTYVIGADDTLHIDVWKEPDLTATLPVRPDGMISLPLLNDVQAAGLTPMQLAASITEKLAEYIPTPEVSVIVREVHSFKVSVIGEVKRPGRHELKSRATVLDALAMAEGLGEFASRGRIVILRPDGNALKRIPFNYNKVVSANGANGELENFLLQPGDIVVVP